MQAQNITTHNPATGSILKSYPTHSIDAASLKLELAASTQLNWKLTSLNKRTELLRRLARILERDKAGLATLMQAEMGKNISEGRAEIEKCVTCALYYAESGPSYLTHQEIPTEAARSFVAFEPLGTVLAVMPWNFPFWQVFRCAIPAILAGNAVVLKHASNVSGCALEAERIWKEALGERNGLFSAVIIPGNAAMKLIDHPLISAVSFTGSTEVGRQIAAAAGAQLKKCLCHPERCRPRSGRQRLCHLSLGQCWAKLHFCQKIHRRREYFRKFR